MIWMLMIIYAQITVLHAWVAIDQRSSARLVLAWASQRIRVLNHLTLVLDLMPDSLTRHLVLESFTNTPLSPVNAIPEYKSMGVGIFFILGFFFYSLVDVRSGLI